MMNFECIVYSKFIIQDSLFLNRKDMLLAIGGLLAPDLGLLFWTSLIFVIFWGMIIKFAYAPLKDSLNQRNSDIQEALDEAGKARLEMKNLKAENVKMVEAAKVEQAQILADANITKENIIAEAKVKAQKEADRIVANAKLEIENQKKLAIAEVKNESSLIALSIAEKVIKRQLAGIDDQENLANELIENIKLS